MAVVTISKNFGCGARDLGRRLAKRLGYAYIDKAYFQKIAEQLDVSERTLESFEQGRQYRIANIFSRLFSKNYIERIVGYDKTVIEEKEYQEALRNLVIGVAQQGKVVLVGRASHIILKDLPNCYHFRIVAPVGWRKEYIIREYGVRAIEADSVLAERDRNREWFLRLMGGEGFDDPVRFHVIANVSLLSAEDIINLFVRIVQRTL
ncbi:MAG: cytidylate kinase-like family protein [Deltaproteobacteria bacterium]|nr:cytidylate kinase-like family protein [Deltaproteobacteria bacterium]MBW2070035.1 cytidylate kinase-like family protein [Deltaproteobacteria bacterium]